MYCVKCKRKTDTVDEYITETKNKRRIKKGTCTICRTRKSQFISSGTLVEPPKPPDGGSIVNTVLTKLPLPEMHLKSAIGAEQVPHGSFNSTNKYSFCGPFTKLQQRLAEGYTGINNLDRACLKHDIAYSTHKDTPTRNIHDDILVAEAAKIVLNPDTPDYEKTDARLVAAVIAGKSRFGLGFKVHQ